MMFSINKHTLKIMGVKKNLRFLIKSFCYSIVQLIYLFLYPLCRVMNIKVFSVQYGEIGHLAGELDCYVKEGILGLRPQYFSILLIPHKNVANRHLLNYWKKYVCIIDSPFIFPFVAEQIKNNIHNYNVLKYFQVTGKSIAAVGIQNRYYGRPPLLSLTDFDRKRGWEALQKLGAPKDAWFVCVHCREARDTNEIQKELSLRNVDINNYFLAMEEVVNRGGWVVRMGDTVMKPIPAMKNIIDYAHLDIKSDWMDVFLCASCRFFLGSRSGLSMLASVFGVPSVIVNVVPFSAILGYGPNDISTPKFIWSEKKKCYFSFKEILSSHISNFLFRSQFLANAIQAIENSPEDIKEVTVEMLNRLEGKLKYSEEDECLQAQFKSLMNPTHYSYGAMSRAGKDFLRKYKHLLE